MRRLIFAGVGIAALSIAIGATGLTHADAATHLLMASPKPDRSDYTPLKGASLSGQEYIFTKNLPGDTTEIKFYLDGKQVSDEKKAPFDFATTDQASGKPRPFDFSTLSAGKHQISYDLYYNSGKMAHNVAAFTVSKSTSSAAPTTTTVVMPKPTTTTTTAKPAATTTTTVAPSASQDWADYPFASTAPANRKIPSTVKFDGSGGAMSTTMRNGSNTAVNSTNWSYAIYKAKASDPTVSVKDPTSGKVIATLKIPASATTTGGTDQPMGIVQPDGYTAYEFYKMRKDASGNWTSPYTVTTDLRQTGLTAGTRASGTSIFWGLIRKDELAKGSINHTLLMGIPSAELKNGQVWPARQQDKFGAALYAGTIPMGTLFAIPKSVNVNSLGLSGEGLALAHTLQDYGAYAMIQSSTTSLFAEPAADQTQVSALRGPWSQLRPYLQAVTNNQP